ncbi:MAG: 3-hydroxyacyl-CoA dehydrogenase NAD-binding domain-containing protein [Kiloniellales bacterium]
MSEIPRVGVIGAGVMGSAIAAHVANAGVPVELLDLVPENADDRDAVAKAAIDRLLASDPAAFMHRRNARLVTPGNIEDHLGRLGDCDWILEAVVEDARIKRDLYRRIEGARKPGSIVSSNTSTIPLARLTEGMPEGFARDFLITHFFNPPRYLRLMELVAGPDTRADAVETIQSFADHALGKGVVICKDTPGFIANRIGIYWLQCAVTEAIDRGLSIEEADAVMGRPLGIPKTGVFGLLDMVGLDLMPSVLASMSAQLPPDDPFHDIYREPELIERMIAKGLTGRKGKGGFYRLDQSDGKRVKQALDLRTEAYRTAEKPKLKSVEAAKKRGPRALVEHGDRGGRYAWRVLSRTLAYAAGLVPEIADDVAAVDQAMRLGFNWKHGPFELIDRLGPAWFAERLRRDGEMVPALLETAAGRPFYRVRDGTLERLGLEGAYRPVPRAPGLLLLSDVKRRSQPLARNRSASLWDIGDGVACLEFHSRMNSLDPLTLAMIRKAVKIVAADYKGLVIHNEGTNFSVGANVGLMLIAARLRARFAIAYAVRAGQKAYKALKYAPFPVVGAPSGMALGGGCEILLHCDAVQAHAETYAGLVETGVGLIPGWGGCKEMLLRWHAVPDRPGGPMPPVTKVFETIGLATVAKSAQEAKDLLFLRRDDGITMNRDRVLADAKAKAVALADGYRPPDDAPAIPLPGKTGGIALTLTIDGLRRSGKATPHDAVVARTLAGVVSGGDTDITESVSEDELFDLEREAFLELGRHPASIARMRHMLETGKPLRN